jgi:hypothetical protein
VSTEAQLVATKARKMSSDELRTELARILRGMSAAQGKGALKRYKTRYEIMSAELTRKNTGGAA